MADPMEASVTDLSENVRKVIPAVDVRTWEWRGIYLDRSRNKVHVIWAVGSEDDKGVFSQHGEDVRDYIIDELDLTGESDKDTAFYTDLMKSAPVRGLEALVEQHERDKGNL